MSEARKHHFIPQSYLKRFGDLVGKNYQVQTIDMLTKKTFPTNVENVASRRDYYRIESGDDPLYVEKFLGTIEGKANLAIEHIEKNGKLPVGEDYDYLINFIACLAARVPQKRAMVEKFNIEVVEKTLAIALADKERWQSLSERVKLESEEELPDVEYEVIKNFLDEKRFKVEISKDHLINSFLQIATHICDLLPMRNWGLLESDCEKGFITSDNPVILMWTKDHFLEHRPPGFGLISTSVQVPLSRKYMLIGTFEPIGEVTKINSKQVATMNTTIKMFAERNIFYSKKSYLWFDGQETNEGPDKFLDKLK